MVWALFPVVQNFDWLEPTVMARLLNISRINKWDAFSSAQNKRWQQCLLCPVRSGFSSYVRGNVLCCIQLFCRRQYNFVIGKSGFGNDSCSDEWTPSAWTGCSYFQHKGAAECMGGKGGEWEIGAKGYSTSIVWEWCMVLIAFCAIALVANVTNAQPVGGVQ